MKRIFIFLLLAPIILSACSNQKTSTLNQDTNATPQKVVEQKIEYKDISRSNPRISLKYPSNASVQDDTSTTALLKLNFELPEKQGNEDLSVSVLRTRPTKAELEDLETDLYNGADRTFGTNKASCYFRSNKYVKDQYTFLNRRYTGSDPDTGYRFDCVMPLGSNFVYLKYQNDLTDLAFFRQREKIIAEMLSSVQ